MAKVVDEKGNKMLLKIEVGVLEVKGPDAGKFLQAICSSDVDQLGQGQTQPSLLLTSSGKLISTIWIHQSSAESYLLVMERTRATAVLENLKKYLIRTKAEILDVGNRYIGVISDLSQPIDFRTVLIEQNHLGNEVLKFEVIEHCDHKDISDSDAQIYDELRISSGAVSTRKDLFEGIIPQEAHLEKLSVSFSKGCYLGQELVCRIDSRDAQTPFTFFAVELISQKAITDLPAKLLVDGVQVGAITSIRNVDDTKVDNLKTFFGRFHAIARVSRKGATIINENTYHTCTVVSEDGKSDTVENIAPVSGYFST